jgi:hypothetical protein
MERPPGKGAFMQRVRRLGAKLEAITKTGNSHVRRLLIEAAWNYRHPPRVGTLARRRKGQPQRVIAPEPPHMAVSGLGDRSQPPALPAGVLRGNETNEGHQLARRDEAMEGVQLGHDAHRGDGVESTKATQSGDCRGVALGLRQLLELDHEGFEARLEVFDGK